MGVQKIIVVGAGPVGALAALYAAKRGDNVHVYELRDGEQLSAHISLRSWHHVCLLHFSLQAPAYRDVTQSLVTSFSQAS